MTSLFGSDSCEVVSSNEHEPDVEIRTDPETWLAMDGGKLSGIEAFGRRQLTMRGSIEKSLHFETLFERPTASATGSSRTISRGRSPALCRNKVLVWEKCGHVPQIEFPDRTAREILRFFDRAAVTKIA